MKVLIIGQSGQLARALLQRVPPNVVVTALDRSALEVSDVDAVARTIRAGDQDVVINATAYTAVDQAESDPKSAYAINEAAVAEMAASCAARGVRFVHVSTDFVFDGSSGRPYSPSDAPNPLNVYGASKLAGERRIQATAGLDWRIVRTAWIYSPWGRNFVLIMLRLFNERPQVRVVADQIGTPTTAASLAQCVWRVAACAHEKRLFHFADAGVASRYDFAVAIYEEGRELGLIGREVEIVPISTEEYPTPARRPHYSVLDTAQTLQALNLAPVHWRTHLRQLLRELSP